MKIIVREKKNEYEVGLGKSKLNINKDSQEEFKELMTILLKLTKDVSYLENTYDFQGNKSNIISRLKGSNNQMLVELSDPALIGIFLNIRDKYLDDRELFLKRNNHIEYFDINATKETSYSLNPSEYGDFIVLNLASKKKELIPFEKEFLIGFINSKLANYDCHAEIESRNNFFNEDCLCRDRGYYIHCDNLVINLNNEELLPLVASEVDKDNLQFSKVKKIKEN